MFRILRFVRSLNPVSNMNTVFRLRGAHQLATFAAALFSPFALIAAIDREAVVHRHDIRVAKVDPEASLSVGNGDFAFTVDATGLQTFESLHYREGIPLETVEVELARQALERCNGNLTQAAKLLDISRDQLRYKLKKSPHAAVDAELS